MIWRNNLAVLRSLSGPIYSSTHILSSSEGEHSKNWNHNWTGCRSAAGFREGSRHHSGCDADEGSRPCSK
jgi:hypothetical protein